LQYPSYPKKLSKGILFTHAEHSPSGNIYLAAAAGCHNRMSADGHAGSSLHDSFIAFCNACTNAFAQDFLGGQLHSVMQKKNLKLEQHQDAL
jgi:hypothetical protein